MIRKGAERIGATSMTGALVTEGAPANDAAIGELALLGADAASRKTLRQRLHGAKLQVTSEDRSTAKRLLWSRGFPAMPRAGT